MVVKINVSSFPEVVHICAVSARVRDGILHTYKPQLRYVRCQVYPRCTCRFPFYCNDCSCWDLAEKAYHNYMFTFDCFELLQSCMCASL